MPHRDIAMIQTHPHPGEMLKKTVFEPLGLSVTEAAERLAMSRTALSRVLNGKAGISPDLALRLEKAGTSTARFWMNLQSNYDLWCAMQHEQPLVRPLQEVGEPVLVGKALSDIWSAVGVTDEEAEIISGRDIHM